MKNLLYIAALSVILLNCTGTADKATRKEIAVSILPEKYFVEKIAGDLVSINVMIPPGASPATYEPTPAQIASLSEIPLYMKMGYTGFELTWMNKLRATNKEMNVVNLSDGIELISEEDSGENAHEGHRHGGVDPHTWLSPGNVKIVANNIYKSLLATYPDHEAEFNINYNSFLAELDSLDGYIRQTLEDLSSRTFFTYHPSLSYFARDYGLEQLPLELSGKTPSSGHLKNLIDQGNTKHIRVIFIQKQFDQKNAEALAKETAAEIVRIDPLDPDWYHQMLFITNKMKEKLK